MQKCFFHAILVEFKSYMFPKIQKKVSWPNYFKNQFKIKIWIKFVDQNSKAATTTTSTKMVSFPAPRRQEGWEYLRELDRDCKRKGNIAGLSDFPHYVWCDLYAKFKISLISTLNIEHSFPKFQRFMIYKILQDQVFIKKFYFQIQILIPGLHLKQHFQKI